MPSTRAFHELLVEDGIDLSWSQVVHGLRAFCAPMSITEFRAAQSDGIPEKIAVMEKPDRLIVQSVSGRITTLDELLEFCKVNLSMWQVERYVLNKWETPRKETFKDLDYEEGKATGYVRDTGLMYVEQLFQVKVWLKPREAQPIEAAIDLAIGRLEKHAPKYKPPRKLHNGGDHLFVPNVLDVHIGERSSDNAYTLARANSDYKVAIDALFSRAQSLGMAIEEILYPLGNDMLHVDNLIGSTTKGTWQETSADTRDAIDAAVDAAEYGIELGATIAPVRVVVVESNHDRLLSYALGKIIEARFRKHPHVTVDARRSVRKYYQYGQTLLGMEHGDKVKPERLVTLMAVEAPEMWAETVWREWLRGHIHTRREMYYAASEEMGVMVRWLAALAPTGTWEKLMGLIGQHRAAEGLFYHREFGPAGSFPVFVDELEAPAARPALAVVDVAA